MIWPDMFGCYTCCARSPYTDLVVHWFDTNTANSISENACCFKHPHIWFWNVHSLSSNFSNKVQSRSFRFCWLAVAIFQGDPRHVQSVKIQSIRTRGRSSIVSLWMETASLLWKSFSFFCISMFFLVSWMCVRCFSRLSQWNHIGRLYAPPKSARFTEGCLLLKGPARSVDMWPGLQDV